MVLKRAFAASIVVAVTLLVFSVVAGAGVHSENKQKSAELNISASVTQQDAGSEINKTVRDPAPTPPANDSMESVNQTVGVTHYPHQNQTIYAAGSDRTTSTTATVNDSVTYSEGFQPIDFSTEPDGDRVKIADTERWPYRAVVRLRIEGPDGQGYSCSGALVSDNHVLTAAHCVYLYDEQGNEQGWAEQIVVVPGANADGEDSEPFGTAEVVREQTFTGWTESQNYGDDMALLTLDRDIGDVTGWFGYGTYTPDHPIYESRSHATGYPGDPPSGEFPTIWDQVDQGNQTSCDFGDSCPTHQYWMITTDGQSGGPVWHKNSSRDRNYQILSVISRSYYSSALPNLGTRITDQKFDYISTWIDESDTEYSSDNRAELASAGSSIEEYDYQSGLKGGDTLDIHQSIKNKGVEETECFRVAFYFSQDSRVTQSDYQIGKSEVCSLAPGETQEVEWSGAIPKDIEGVYTIGAIIDPNSEIDEYDDYTNQVRVKETVLVHQADSLDLRSISIGETRPSILDGKDPVGFRGNYEPVTVSGQAGQNVWIDMQSSGDSYLLLQNPDGEIIASDDSGDKQRAQVQHEFRETGEYTIIATSDDDSGKFWYELSTGSVAEDGSTLTATRTIEEQRPRPGETVPITIEANLRARDGIQITDTFASNLTGNITDGFGVLDIVMDDQITFNNPSGVGREYRVAYEVMIPEEASPGTNYTFNGTVQRAQAAAITGDSTLTVQSGEWHEPYINEDGVVTNTGLNIAVSDYLGGDLTDAELNAIVQSYLGGGSVRA